MPEKNTPLISIIIPVYNVAPYLIKCLESVQCQTYRNIEIILIDDGSTDDSGKICEEYAKKDSRIRVIHKKNGGLSDARNAGLNVFRGEYVSFIDSDDHVETTYIERLYQLMKSAEADISIVSFIRIYETKEEKRKEEKSVVREYGNAEAISDMWYQKNITPSAWAKLYRRQLFSEIRYPVGKLYEDLGTTYKLFFLSTKIVYSSERLYYYLQRNEGIMRCKFSLKKMDRIRVSQELLIWCQKYCIELLPAAQTRFFIANMQVLRELPLDGHYKAETETIKRNIKEYRKKVIQNKNAKKSTRIIAICSIIDIRCLKFLGGLYKKIYK